MKYKKMKDISIIIPIYNVEKYVAECLNSVINQTYDHSKIECILVDDCTPDKSMNIANELIANYNGDMTFIIKKHDHNQGLSAARNTGIDIATGTYIYFIDSDDYIYPNSIATLMSASDNKNTDIVIGNHYRESYKRTEINKSKSCYLKNLNVLYWGKTMKIQAWNTLMKRNIIITNRLRFNIGRYFEDVVFTSQLYQCVRTATVIPDCTYFYRSNPAGIMLNSSKEKLDKSYSDYLFSLDVLTDPHDNRLRVGRNARTVLFLYYMYDMLKHNGDTLSDRIQIENEMSRISLSLINYNLQHFRLFLFFHSLLGVKPIANILINNGIFRRNLDKLFCLFLYPALWADKFHK